MNDELSHKFEDAQSEDMIQILNEFFDIPEDAKRHKISCTLFNAHMREGTSVTDHVLYMIEQIERLSKLDFLLYEQLGKDVILNSLLKSYLSFLSHHRMTKPTVNYHDLLGLLQMLKRTISVRKSWCMQWEVCLQIVDPLREERRKGCRRIVPSIQSQNRAKSQKSTRARQNTSFARSQIIEKKIVQHVQLSLTQIGQRAGEISNQLLRKVLI